jgi:DNA-directed RNA polymerase specialized sigma24 family protein
MPKPRMSSRKLSFPSPGKMPQFQYDLARGSFKGWLLKLTQWRITDELRKRQRLAEHCPNPADKTEIMELVPGPDAEARFSHIWEEEWEQNLLFVALERVKPHVSARTFQIYQLHLLRDWPVEKVTRTLGVGRAAIYVAKCRVGARLKKELLKLRKTRPGIP